MVELARRAPPELPGLASTSSAVPAPLGIGSTPMAATTPGDGLAGGVGIRLLPPASRYVFHGDAAARAAASRVWGGFSEDACRAMVQGERATLWLGPDEYLLLGPAAESGDATIVALGQALGQTPHALVDVSHRQIALQLNGPHAATILNAGCPLDLDIGEFPIGMCTRTIFGKADIVLWRVGADVFHIEAWRSFTGYLAQLLREISREFIPPN